jgi:hypothetical protein
MSWFEMSEEELSELSQRGIDWDLQSCLAYNGQEYAVTDIEKVLAVHTGQNDGDDWRWVMLLKDGRYVFLMGGCDYTGWDCQSWATSAFADTPEDAARHALGDIKLTGTSPTDAGMGHMLSIFSGTYTDNWNSVYEELMAQLRAGKDQTWREQTDKDMPNLPKISPDSGLWYV